MCDNHVLVRLFFIEMQSDAKMEKVNWPTFIYSNLLSKVETAVCLLHRKFVQQFIELKLPSTKCSATINDFLV